MRFKLGRKAVKRDSRRLMLRNYLPAGLPAPPLSVDYTKGIVTFGAMLNDELGCCTIAGCGHAVQIWTANSGSEVTLSDSVIEQYYSEWDGYVPGDPSTDQGGIEESVLDDWRQHGLAGHALTAYADPDVTNQTEIQQAIFLFLGVYIGMNVPNFIMADVPPLWDVSPSADNGIAGGHCVFVVGYDAQGVTFVSWGSLYKMTWAFWRQFIDEAHSLMSPDLLGSTGLAASGFNSTQLLADLAAIV